MVSLLRDRDLRQRLGRNARERARSSYNEARFDAGVREAYAAIESLRGDGVRAESDGAAVLGGRPE